MPVWVMNLPGVRAGGGDVRPCSLTGYNSDCLGTLAPVARAFGGNGRDHLKHSWSINVIDPLTPSPVSSQTPAEGQKPLGVGEWLAWLYRPVTIEEGLRRRVDNFLLIRIVAASMVIYGHATAIAPAVNQEDFFVWLGVGHYSGHIAVNIFFMVSGFLVTGSLLRQRNVLNFFKLRALRLVPGYLVNLVLLALVLGTIMTTLPVGEYLRRPEVWKYIIQNLHFSSNMVWNLPGVFENGMKSSVINGSQWTLPAEVRMYVLLGVAGLIGLFRSVRVASWSTLVVMSLGAFFPHFLPLHQDWFRLGMYFSIGVLAYLHRGTIQISYVFVLGLIGLAVLTRQLPGYELALALAISAIVFAIAYLTPPVRWLERYGDPSYGIYLWGWPCQQLVAYFLPGAGLTVHVSISVIMAVVLGYASWHLVEKHALKLK